MQPSVSQRDSAADAIQDVECVECVVPLPRPLRTGATTVTRRTYAFIRLRTVRGLDGVGFAYGRGLPVAHIIQTLEPLLIGADAATPETIRQRLQDAFWPYGDQGLFRVAVSAVDLALWDLLGKRHNAPLANLLGRRRQEVPVCAIGGYSAEGNDSLTSLQESMADFMQRGVGSVKVTIGAGTPEWDVDRLAAVRSIVGDSCRVAVDAFRSFTGLDDALRRLRLLERFNLSFVEDPFPENLAPLIADLRRRTGMAIALGESLSGHRAYRDLIAAGCVDVVRCDATVVGGVREFMAVAALASAYGCQIATHVHQDVHIHFAAALSNLYEGGMEYMLVIFRDLWRCFFSDTWRSDNAMYRWFTRQNSPSV